MTDDIPTIHERLTNLEENVHRLFEKSDLLVRAGLIQDRAARDMAALAEDLNKRLGAIERSDEVLR